MICGYKGKKWVGGGAMSGYKGKKGGHRTEELNAFYARFDCIDFSQTRCGLMDRLAEIPVGEQGETLKVTNPKKC